MATAAGAVVGAVVVGSDTAEAAPGAPLLLESTNSEGASTTLLKAPSTDPSPAFQVFNSVDSEGTIGGSALLASPITGLVGLAGVPVTMSANIPAGVMGMSSSSPSSGVLGLFVGADPLGSVSFTASAGVTGMALDTMGVGIEAIGFNPGLALKVMGEVDFSTSGHLEIPAHAKSVFVPDTGVTANSLIFVTLIGNPGPATVKWVEPVPDLGFHLNLTKAVHAVTPACYFRIS